MNIPLEIVNKGSNMVNEYVETKNKISELNDKHREAQKKFYKILNSIYDKIGNVYNSYPYKGRLYFDDNKNEWWTDTQQISRLVDDIWTKQNNLDSVFSEYVTITNEYIDYQEKLKRIIE